LGFIFFLCHLLVVVPTISIVKRTIVELKTLLIFLITIEVYPFNHDDTSNFLKKNLLERFLHFFDKKIGKFWEKIFFLGE
jgi:hypothetical protein